MIRGLLRLVMTVTMSEELVFLRNLLTKRLWRVYMWLLLRLRRSGDRRAPLRMMPMYQRLANGVG